MESRRLPELSHLVGARLQREGNGAAVDHLPPLAHVLARLGGGLRGDG